MYENQCKWNRCGVSVKTARRVLSILTVRDVRCLISAMYQQCVTCCGFTEYIVSKSPRFIYPHLDIQKGQLGTIHLHGEAKVKSVVIETLKKLIK